MSQQAIDKLRRFQGCYSETSLWVNHPTGSIIAGGKHGVLIPDLGYSKAAEVLTAAGYVYVSEEYHQGWYPATLVRRNKLTSLHDDIKEGISQLAGIGHTLTPEAHRLSLEAQELMCKAGERVCAIRETIK